MFKNYDGQNKNVLGFLTFFQIRKKVECSCFRDSNDKLACTLFL